MRVALIHNVKPKKKLPDLPFDYYSECDSPATVSAIAKALRRQRFTVLPVEANHRLPAWLKRNHVDLAFNIAEGFYGDAREARVPALLELLEIPYTGSGVLALVLALDKNKAKHLFRSAGVPTPNFQLFLHPDEPIKRQLQFPLIVKPNREGSGKGIWASSVVHDEKAFRTQLRLVHDRYAQEVLVEEYIEGTELTVGLLGGDEVLPVLEVDFSGCESSGEFFYSWRMKEFQGNQEMGLTPSFWCPARLDPGMTQAVQSVAWRAARALGANELARVDIRLSSDGIPYVLEVNPLPGLDPAESNLPLMAKAAGMSYDTLIQRIVTLAVSNRTLRSGRMAHLKAIPPKAGASLSSPSSQKAHSTLRRSKKRPLTPAKKGSGSAGEAVAVRSTSRRRTLSPRKTQAKEGRLGR